jgi:F0F1-type ATP synthase assembly protein I
MLTAIAPMPCVSAVLGEFTDASIGSGPRLLYAFRLIGALLVATLVPLLIDRRSRR